MFLSEVLEHLEHGELSQLAMGGNECESIDCCNLANILPHINMGLAELYKRFPLKMGDVIVQQYDHIQTYFLKRKYAQSNTESKEPVKYIVDSKYQPFIDNVNKIERIIDELGRELFVNNSTEYWSVYTPSYDSIQVPLPEKENQMIVHYRAGHQVIKLDCLDPAKTEIEIPPGYLEALLYYIGSRILTGLNTDGQISEGNNYMQKFEQSCAKITELNLMNNDNTSNLKLDNAGWV